MNKSHQPLTLDTPQRKVQSPLPSHPPNTTGRVCGWDDVPVAAVLIRK